LEVLPGRDSNLILLCGRVIVYTCAHKHVRSEQCDK